ncbi:hypothetical protein Sarmat_00193 [Rickettsiales endosymbiont of Paramecium tredecaurelia]|uniref:hypothetical protein n=1 Tax=Candidatus Sarmatiella mevalonica TaxID=2770581 RepID=UPI001921B0B3|nr:hypothetical protein [Candidatus Sarmatiella mevalonica]MBL3284353.1 hypothetical protein [Candidatus Sarmatiella mevalonica]
MQNITQKSSLQWNALKSRVINSDTALTSTARVPNTEIQKFLNAFETEDSKTKTFYDRVAELFQNNDNAGTTYYLTAQLRLALKESIINGKYQPKDLSDVIVEVLDSVCDKRKQDSKHPMSAALQAARGQNFELLSVLMTSIKNGDDALSFFKAYMIQRGKPQQG